MVTTGALYSAGTLLALGRCSLLPDEVPTNGTLVGGTRHLLAHEVLTLVLPNHRTLQIAPRRVVHLEDEEPLLEFDVVG